MVLINLRVGVMNTRVRNHILVFNLSLNYVLDSFFNREKTHQRVRSTHHTGQMSQGKGLR